jgi:hypothetical protein
MVNLKGFGRKELWYNQHTVSAFAWRNRGKEWKTLRIVGIVSEIGTKHLPNGNLEHYCHTTSFVTIL